MAGPMEFWGIEVKAKEPRKVSLEEGYAIHVSQATLGDIKKDTETVIVHVKVGAEKLVMGMLSHKTPQLSFDLVFDQDFEISHNWKNGSIHLLGYKTDMLVNEFDDDEDSESDEEPVPLLREIEQAAAPVPKVLAVKPKAENKVKPDDDTSSEDDGSSDDEDSEDGDSDEEMSVDGSEDGSENEDEDDSEDSEDSEDEKPAKVDNGKKRANGDTKTPQSKKAKIATPQKTDGKKGVVHPGTPHPAKKGGKTPGSNKTPNSGGSDVSCGPCKKTFKSEGALSSHTKAKHGAK